MFYLKALIVALFALFVIWMQWSSSSSWRTSAFIVLAMVIFVSSVWKTVRIFCLTFRRELSNRKWQKQIIARTKEIITTRITFPVLFQKTVKNFPQKTAFIFEGEKWTFEEADNYANKVANYFNSIGYKKGDTVAIFLENKPEFICLWLGLGKLGVISALVNVNLRQESLIHVIKVTNAKSVIFGNELADVIKDIVNDLDENIDLFSVGESDVSKALCLDQVFQNVLSDQPPPLEERSPHDTLLYLYTSGTTGLPKATPITNLRAIRLACNLSKITDMRVHDKDIIYICLPFYHATGGIVGVGTGLLTGATTVIRRKFSASNFWKDCVDNNVTITFYVGELCRYLIAQPHRPWDKQLKVRGICGNGMRPQVWKEFQKRFNIPMILEFYGSSEGTFGLWNADGTAGSCGYYSVLFPSSMWYGICQVDADTCELKRSPDGMAVPCQPGEPGMAVGKIRNKASFLGYVNNSLDTNKKIAHNVFKSGDTVYLTGDMLVYDDLGHVYFIDRLGDTFRWKGENVSASEIESIITKMTNHTDVIVYGVEIPGTEGRAGMAAISDPDETINLTSLSSGLKKILPSYAIPVFIRICPQLDVTGTFKLVKGRFKREEYNLGIIQDSIYFLDHKTGDYLQLNEDVFDKIKNGKIQF